MEVRDRRALRRSAVIPMTGWAVGRFGIKRTYMIVIALFTAGSALYGRADWFRVLKALRGGMPMPPGMTVMASPRDRTGSAS
jgi:MFS family permease